MNTPDGHYHVGFNPHPEEELEQWLTDQRQKLNTDIATTLDIEAGLREALILTHHTDLIADLNSSLDIEAGLVAILPVVPDVMLPNEPLPHNPHHADTEHSAETNPDQANAEQEELNTILRKLARNAASWSLTTRLAMRAHPIFTLTSVRDRDRDVDHDLYLVRDLAPALAPALDLARALDRDLTRVRALARALAHDRVRKALLHVYNVLSDVTELIYEASTWLRSFWKGCAGQLRLDGRQSGKTRSDVTRSR